MLSHYVNILSLYITAETAAAPILIHQVELSASATLQWNHTEKGDCYDSVNFSYNVTWYSVVGGVLQLDAQTITTQSGAKEVAIQGIKPGTLYHVEIVGFSTDNAFPVTSQLLPVNLTTKGMHCFVCVYRYSFTVCECALEVHVCDLDCIVHSVCVCYFFYYVLCCSCGDFITISSVQLGSFLVPING